LATTRRYKPSFYFEADKDGPTVTRLPGLPDLRAGNIGAAEVILPVHKIKGPP